MCLELSRDTSTPASSYRPKPRKRRPSKRERRAERRRRNELYRRAQEQAELADQPAPPADPPSPGPGPRPKLPMFAGNALGLLNAFEQGTLDREDWTHAAHVVVAVAYAHGNRLDAYSRLREGIQRYNRLSGFVETPTRGYHETITQAWFHLVLHYLDLFDEGQPLQELVDGAVELFERDELFRHYSREQLLSAGARAGWVEPDREPLPVLEELTPADRRWLQSLEVATPVAAPRAEAVGAGFIPARV